MERRPSSRSSAAPDELPGVIVLSGAVRVDVSDADGHAAAASSSSSIGNNSSSSGGNGSGGSSGSDVDDKEVELRMKRKLAFYFMDPIQKFKARRQVPWKLLLQFLKVVLVTAQILVFGRFRYAHSNYYEDNRIALQHLFFQDWDSVREVNAYPPATGDFALYRRSEFYERFNYAASAFATLEDTIVNQLTKNSSLSFCIEEPVSGSSDYDDYNFYGADDYNYDGLGDFIGFPNLGKAFITRCITIPDDRLANLDSKKYLKEVGFEVPWITFRMMTLNFTVLTSTFRRQGTQEGPECFRFRVTISFDNGDHDSKVSINLTLQPERILCKRKTRSSDAAKGGNLTSTSSGGKGGNGKGDGNANSNGNATGVAGQRTQPSGTAIATWALNYLVIIVCLCSLVLCARALLRAQALSCQTTAYFKTKLDMDLTFSERCQFLNLWYVVICINDILLVTGSIITELIETRKTNGDLWDFCSIFLGTGNLLVWVGMLRYLGFFKAYNALILTLKRSLPNVLRFIFCVTFVYAGYVICGWIVFAPYHFKFKNLGSTSECLFSLVNGDDMFATFSMISEKVGVIHGFSRLYLYSFVMLFIYVILSLFIAIIMDTYDNIKEFYEKGFPRSRIDEFYMSEEHDPYSDVFFNGSAPSLLYRGWAWFMYRNYGTSWKGYHRYREEERILLGLPAHDDEEPPVETSRDSVGLVVHS